ncbi:hypothetical protein [Pseudodesulfovibrio sp. JC047]|uniref:EAL and HDOD domain-containing protein n=1 Tax=Pseudodesulfovibrio sp. JC047 TaxID=2683199 RepID=UPI001EF2B602|nr:hypothetical protein [Pseudodesulfovibrio sp. JC047]
MARIIPTYETVFIARQPVFRSNETVWGYELLFRSSAENIALVTDEDRATSSVIADGLAMATDGMDSDSRILINFPEKLLVEDGGFSLPKERCIIEILEHVKPHEETLQAVKRLKDAGYTIAVDDYCGQFHLQPFLDLADIIKVDILEFGSDFEQIKKIVHRAPEGVTLLAEKG